MKVPLASSSAKHPLLYNQSPIGVPFNSLPCLIVKNPHITLFPSYPPIP